MIKKKAKQRNKTIIKGLFQVCRGDGSCPSQHTKLPTTPVIYLQLILVSFENDQNQPLVNMVEKECIERIWDINQEPNNPASLKGQESQRLWDQAAEIERDVSILMSPDLSLQVQGEKV